MSKLSPPLKFIPRKCIAFEGANKFWFGFSFVLFCSVLFNTFHVFARQPFGEEIVAYEILIFLHLWSSSCSARQQWAPVQCFGAH